MKIQESIALVTGSNRGLGKYFVHTLIERGANKVYACARNPEDLSNIAQKCEDRIIPIKLDVTSDNDVSASVQKARDVNLLINNAGVLMSHGLIESGGLKGLSHEMEVNVFGVARMMLAFAPVLSANGGGAILNILSVSSLVAYPPFGTYAASKAAAMSLTSSSRHELKKQNTDVHGLYAGYIDTDMIDYLDAEKSRPYDIAMTALDGIEAGLIDIDADESAVSVRAALRNDPEGLIQSSSERGDKFRRTHPLTQ